MLQENNAITSKDTQCHTHRTPLLQQDKNKITSRDIQCQTMESITQRGQKYNIKVYIYVINWSRLLHQEHNKITLTLLHLCSGVHCTHCSATKIFGNCDTSRPSLHSSRQQVSIFFFFSMHIVVHQFSKHGVLNAVKRLFLLIPKTFHNNWYLKQHECGLIWV